jgi:hypothetical protein
MCANNMLHVCHSAYAQAKRLCGQASAVKPYHCCAVIFDTLCAHVPTHLSQCGSREGRSAWTQKQASMQLRPQCLHDDYALWKLAGHSQRQYYAW